MIACSFGGWLQDVQGVELQEKARQVQALTIQMQGKDQQIQQQQNELGAKDQQIQQQQNAIQSQIQVVSYASETTYMVSCTCYL